MREFVGIKPPLDLLLEVFSKGLPVNSIFKHARAADGRFAAALARLDSNDLAVIHNGMITKRFSLQGKRSNSTHGTKRKHVRGNA
jgi:hypothetical protein